MMSGNNFSGTIRKQVAMIVMFMAMLGQQLWAFVAWARSLPKRINHKLGEEPLVTIEAADRDLPVPVGSATRATAMKMNSRGQIGLGTVLAGFTVVIAAMVVLLVVDRFQSSLGDPSSSALSSSQQSILSGFADMTSLIGPMLLIAIGVVIIGLIRRVQG